VKAAWESQRGARSPADVRLFDATLNGIQAALKSGNAEDLADAKDSLDEFVRGALRGIEP
jgi:hypothetical protein